MVLLPRRFRSWVTPKELGWDQFPEIRKIYLGKCGGVRGINYSERNPAKFGLAHAHISKELDKTYRVVCLLDKEYATNIDGTPSDIMWHEYAHILDPLNDTYIFEFLGTPNNKKWNDAFTQRVHGESFLNTCKGLGKLEVFNSSIPRGKEHLWLNLIELQMNYEKENQLYAGASPRATFQER